MLQDSRPQGYDEVSRKEKKCSETAKFVYETGNWRMLIFLFVLWLALFFAISNHLSMTSSAFETEFSFCAKRYKI